MEDPIHQLIDQMLHDDEDNSLATHKELERIGASAVPQLTVALSGEQGHRAAMVLGEIGLPAAEAIPALANLLESKRSKSEAIICALSQMGPLAVPPLVEALHDKDSFIRYDAAYALGRIGSEAYPAQRRLQYLADADISGRVRRVAVESLEKIGTPLETGFNIHLLLRCAFVGSLLGVASKLSVMSLFHISLSLTSLDLVNELLSDLQPCFFGGAFTGTMFGVLVEAFYRVNRRRLYPSALVAWVEFGLEWLIRLGWYLTWFFLGVFATFLFYRIPFVMSFLVGSAVAWWRPKLG